MFEKPEVLTIASSLAAHAGARQAAIAENVANADTPGYRAQDLPDFSKIYRSNDGDPLRATRTGHLSALAGDSVFAASERAGTGAMSPNGNSVSLEAEMVKAAEVKREHDLALAVYGKSLAILRASLGRR
ncbi:MAG: FlgB family protein [Rhodobacteraceae bacterium]|nr:FlgB family protein [Paracoccaceae bacterium]